MRRRIKQGDSERFEIPDDAHRMTGAFQDRPDHEGVDRIVFRQKHAAFDRLFAQDRDGPQHRSVVVDGVAHFHSLHSAPQNLDQ